MSLPNIDPRYAATGKPANRAFLFVTIGIIAGAVLLLGLFLVVYHFRIKPEDKLEYTEVQYCLTTPPKKSLRDLYAKLEEYSTAEKVREIQQTSYFKTGGSAAVRQFLQEEQGEYGRWSWVKVNPASNLNKVDPGQIIDVVVVVADEGDGSGAWGGGSSPRRRWYLLIGADDEILGWIAADR